MNHNRKIPIRKAGCIVVGKNNPDLILIINRESQDDYTFPKGHVEEGESFEQCALREAKEETGLDVIIINEFGLMKYQDSMKRDIVCMYFVAIPSDDDTAKPEENCSIKWEHISDIKNKISYDNLREFFIEHIHNLKIKK